MRAGHYTRLKGRTSYFRRKLPGFLQQRLAFAEICFRLGVVSADSAERLGRRLAVVVDEFVERAAGNAMLNTTDLQLALNHTIAAWRQSDERRAAELAISWGRRNGSPREDAELFAEMAADVLEQEAAGRPMHQSGYVAAALAQAGAVPPEDPVEMHTVRQQFSVSPVRQAMASVSPARKNGSSR